MARKKDYTNDVLDLVESGYYNVEQQINGGEIEEYEGCRNNIFMVLLSGEAKVSLLDASDPRAKNDFKTYCVEYSTFIGNITLIIW